MKISKYDVGTRHGMLTVVARVDRERLDVLCDCGNAKVMRRDNIKRRAKPSCGCAQFARESNPLRARERRRWAKMKSRCEEPSDGSYQNYGARGIVVCYRWQDFETFYGDMGDCPEGMSLDRIDNDGPYSPENCRWATLIQQANNTRKNVLLDTNHGQLTLAQASRLCGIHRDTLYDRIFKLGMDTEDAMAKKADAKATRLEMDDDALDWEKMSKFSGINKGTLRYRINKMGMTLEEAIYIPVDRTRANRTLSH